MIEKPFSLKKVLKSVMIFLLVFVSWTFFIFSPICINKSPMLSSISSLCSMFPFKILTIIEESHSATFF
ncbi:MAG: hypothetical protein BWY04_01218 [candidate division CPR1 bacterium ADurb.Bin160]|uniref:Uncharacterized protein n=1 Tax=candidate division CPR1 bacterium ADurb.Bin160 TaxID=1852826 RepID=A0A1V5ZKP3_9BACT|nr:MAG: hypothetical protein BWY04_01218 [candidate division CPR1 bacterium ADurb.Bin160]